MCCLLCNDVAGPVSNMHRNIETAALSLSCNLDLQINNSKLLWRDVVKPFIVITQELVVRLKPERFLNTANE